MTEPASIERAIAAIRRGEVVVIPTDTVYGVAVDPFQPGATDRLFAVKRRPRDMPLPVLVASAGQLKLVAEVPESASRLVARFWPGALTIVLRRRDDWDADLGEVADTVGVRCPDHPVPRELAEAVGPFAATSANRHGLETPVTAAGVAEQLELDDSTVVVDGGPCRGAPSTVVGLTGGEPALLREGAVPWTAVLDALGGP